MKDVAEHGRTVLFVSHNMLAIRRLCSRTLLLGQGGIIANGDTLQILKEYESVAMAQPCRQEWPDLQAAPGSDVCRIRRVRVVNCNHKDIDSIDLTEMFFVEMTFDVLVGNHLLTPNFHFYNEASECLFVSQDLDPTWRTKKRPVGRYCCNLSVPGNLLSEGRITIGAAITSFNPFVIHGYEQDCIGVTLIDSYNPRGARGDYSGSIPGAVRPLLEITNEYFPINPESPLSND
jgi:lipopolysaccharide transport system ATP-binding protein